jgi:hypothetical protein
MTKRLFLHVGMPKCATTTVQAFLQDQSEALARENVHFRFPPGTRERHQGNGAKLAEDILADRRDAWQRKLDFFLEPEGDVIISSEVLFGLFATPAMNDVAERIRAKGFETTVVTYLRRQDIWVESDYKQQIKGGKPWTDALPDLVEKRRRQGLLNYAMTLTYWGKFFGRSNIHPVLLRPGQPKDHALRALIDLVGVTSIPAGATEAMNAANVSPPTGLIEPARLLKIRLQGEGMDPMRVHHALGRFFAEAPKVIDVPPRRFLLDTRTRRAMVSKHRRANTDLAERFLTGPAFDDHVEADPASDAPLAEEAKAVLDAYVAARGVPRPQVPQDDEAPAPRRAGFLGRGVRWLRGSRG